MGCCKSIIDQLSDNAVLVDARETEQAIRTEHPRILKDGEFVEWAFRGRGGKGRDSFVFTTKRILVRDVKGFTGAKLEYRSCPYHNIRAWSVQTVGSVDRDVELKVYAKGFGKIKMSFVYDSVDIIAIKRYINSKVLPKKGQGAPPTNIAQPGEGQDVGNVQKFFDVLGDNARLLDPKDIEAKLRQEVDLLDKEELVEMAYQCGRDFTCFTNKRILQVDVKGVTGTRRQYRSILWHYCAAFAVETAGTFFDVDAELTIYTRVPDLDDVTQDLRKEVNVMDVLQYLSNKILGMDTEKTVGIPTTPEAQRAAGEKSSWGKAGDLLAWLGDDMKMLDAKEADAQFHAGGSAPILQGCESVELAFKGRRDMVLFTTKRFIEVDIQGFFSKSKKYISVPWSAVKAFSIESAGTFDNDSEVKLLTHINNIEPGHPGDDDNPEKLPDPHLSCISLDFRKDKVDLFAIQKYLAQRILGKDLDSNKKVAEISSINIAEDANSDTGIFDWIGDNYREVDPKQIDDKFRNAPPILLDNEDTVMAFKCGRDLTLYTTKRILRVDTQGITGKKVEYMSIPYTSIKAFSVESAGSWDRDAEVKVRLDSPWMPEFAQDFRKGKADIIALQSFLAAQVLSNTDGSSGLSENGMRAAAEAAKQASAKAGPIQRFFDWIGDNAKAISAEEVDAEFHSSPPILQSDEKAELAFKCGRDLFVITTKRFLKIDTQGFTGQKVEYLSIPLFVCSTFSVESAGSWDFDGETSVCTDIPERDYYGHTWYWSVSQDMSKGNVDLMTVQEWLSSKLMKD